MRDKLIATGLCPHIRWKDMNPFSRSKSPWFFLEELYVCSVIPFDSGRSALRELLNIFGAGQGDEVILQGFTCCVVPAAIMAVGARPVYVDCDEYRLTMDLEDLRTKVTEKTKVIIVQHTFGVMQPMEEILSIALEKDIKVIEDCAHVVGAKYKRKPLGTFGDGAIISFGSDKPFTALRGGAVIMKNYELAQQLQGRIASLPKISLWEQCRYLWTPLLFMMGKSWYHWKIGKVFLKLCRMLKVLPSIVTTEEKNGRGLSESKQFPKLLTKRLGRQLQDMEKINTHRIELNKYFVQNLSKTSVKVQEGLLEESTVPLRTTVFVENQDEIMRKAKAQNILLGDWYTTVLAPASANMEAYGYVQGACPNAEKVVKKVLNVPLHGRIKTKEMERILAILP